MADLIEGIMWSPGLPSPWKDEDHIVYLESRVGKVWAKDAGRQVDLALQSLGWIPEFPRELMVKVLLRESIRVKN